jgi:probable F420-dependent oxidoreductase
VHPFRFSVSGKQVTTAAAWADLARRAEELGYAALSLADHLDETFAPLPALMAAAAATTRLRVMPLVLAVDYRHPALLAKELATVDVLSGGRLDIGIGAGWMTSDYQQAGIALDPPGTRIERLAEAVAVLKRAFSGGAFTHHGTHYRITDLHSHPAPLQRPRPPLLLAGGGKRMLTLAAREADIVGINVSLAAGVMDERVGPDATRAATDRKVDWIREAAGSRFDDLELQVRVHLAVVTDDRRAIAEAMGPALGISADDALTSPHALVGTVEEICDQIVDQRRRWGISYYGWNADAMEAMAPVVQRLAGH